MVKLLLFCLLLVVYWPLAVLALVLYPVVWLLLLPFRILGVAMDGVLELPAAGTAAGRTVGKHELKTMLDLMPRSSSTMRAESGASRCSAVP